MTDHAPMQVLANSKKVVDTLLANGPMTPAELAEAIGVPRSTAYRLAGALTAVNLTELQANGTFDLSLRWLHLADTAFFALSEWADTHEALAKLSQETRQTAFLSVRRGFQSVCVDSVTGQGPGMLVVRRGYTAPLHAGAPGRTFLANLARPDEYLQRAPFAQLTTNTITTSAALAADIDLIRARGYAMAEEDVMTGLSTIAVAVFDLRHVARGCVCLGGLADEIRRREQELASALQAVATTLEHSLPGG